MKMKTSIQEIQQLIGRKIESYDGEVLVSTTIEDIKVRFAPGDEGVIIIGKPFMWGDNKVVFNVNLTSKQFDKLFSDEKLDIYYEGMNGRRIRMTYYIE